MKQKLLLAGVLALATAADTGAGAATLSDIETIVVIYAENRSFDNLYGVYPGANGLSNLQPADYQQRDRDGSVMKELPPVWGRLSKAVPQDKTAHLPNAPFAIDDPKGFNQPLAVDTRDLWHRFYENQMQIDGGKNDRFAAWADSGGLVMAITRMRRRRCGGSRRNSCLPTISSWAGLAARSSIISSWSAPARRSIRMPPTARPRASSRWSKTTR